MPEYEVGSLYALIGVDNKPFMAGMAQSQAAMDATAKKMQASTAKTAAATSINMKKVGQTMSRVGKDLSTYVTLPIVVAGAASAKFAIDFQSQMQKLKTQAGATVPEVIRMSKAILALAASGKVAQGPDELAKGLYHIESVGIRGARALNILKVAAEGAAVGGSKLEDTTSALAGVVITGIQGAHNFAHAMGIVNATVGAGNMKMADLVEALKSGIAPVAKTAGLSLQSLSTALAMMTDEGIPAGVAANRLRTGIFMLTNPTQKAETVLKSLGLTSTSLGHDLRQPNGILVAMQDLKQHLSGIQDPTKRLADLGKMFGGSRSAGTIAMLLNNLGRLKVKYEQIGKTAGSFNRDVLKTQQTAAFKLKAAWAQLQAAMVKVGAVALPVIVQMAQKVAALATGFSKLSQGTQGFILKAALVAAALGPIVFVVGKLIGLYQALAAASMWAARGMGLASASGEAGAAAGALTSAGTPLTDLRAATTAEEAGMAGVGAEAAAIGGPLTILAGIVGIVGLAMVKGGGDTDVLSGAYQRAQGAINGLVPAVNNLKAAQTGATGAQLAHRQAQLNVAAAQQQVNQLVKAGQKGTLAYKQAVLQVAEAHQQEVQASAGDQLAKQHLKQTTEATTKALKASRGAYNEVTAAAQKHIKAVEQDSSKQLRGQGLLKNFGDAANTTSSIIQNYAAKMQALSSQYDTVAGKLQASNPILAANKRHMAEVAGAAAAIARQINAIPTMKMIHIFIETNRQGAGNVNTGVPGGTSGNPHGHTVTRNSSVLRPSMMGASLVASVVASAKAAAPAGEAAFERIVRNIMQRMRNAIGKYGPRIVQEFRNLAQQIVTAFDAQTQKMQNALSKQLGGMTEAGKQLQALQAAHDEAARQQAITDARSALALATAQGDPAAILAAQQQLDDALYQEQVAQLERLDQAEQAARAKKVAAEKQALAQQRADLKRHIAKVLAELKKAEAKHAGKKRIKALEKLLQELLNGGGGGGGKKGAGGKTLLNGGGQQAPHITFQKGAIQVGGVVHTSRQLQDLIAGALVEAARRNPQVLGGVVA